MVLLFFVILFFNMMIKKINAYKELLNVIIMSCGFMLIYTAFETTSTIEEAVLFDLSKEDANFTGDGYTSLSIVYAGLTLGCLLSPIVASRINSKSSILIGAVSNNIFIISFLWPLSSSIYTSSAIKGLGSALIWTGHGQYITENSNPVTIVRNSGIFWAIYQLSLVLGSLFVYFSVTGSTYTKHMRQQIFLILSILSVSGTSLILMIKKTKKISVQNKDNIENDNDLPELKKNIFHVAKEDMKSFLNLSISPKMLLLIPSFIYSGLVKTFHSAVYPSSVGFTVKMSKSRKQLINIITICNGVGGILGGIAFGSLGFKSRIRSDWVIVSLGLLTHTISYSIIFLTLPNNAPFKDTEDIGFISPSPVLAMIAALTIGFGDACFNTKIMSFLSTHFATNIAAGVSIFYLYYSLTATISFFYSNYFGLYVQLPILFFNAVLGTLCFCIIDLKFNKINSHNDSNEENNKQINTN